MEPKVSPPDAGGVARSAGVVRHAEMYTSPGPPRLRPNRLRRFALHQEGKPSVPFLKIWRYETLATKPLLMGGPACRNIYQSGPPRLKAHSIKAFAFDCPRRS
jgi:hypothetical protein